MGLGWEGEGGGGLGKGVWWFEEKEDDKFVM